MLAFEGRIRRKWWLGIFLLTGVCLAASAAFALAVNRFMQLHPELEQNLANPSWTTDPEGANILFQLGLWTIIPGLALVFAGWSSLALRH